MNNKDLKTGISWAFSSPILIMYMFLYLAFHSITPSLSLQCTPAELLYPSTLLYGFAAVRLAVLEEPETEEDVIFDQQPQPPKTGWSLNTEDTNPEDKPHNRGCRHKSKVTESAQSEVAFSSPLVRLSPNRETEKTRYLRQCEVPLSYVLISQRSQCRLVGMRKHVGTWSSLQMTLTFPDKQMLAVIGMALQQKAVS